MQMSYDEQVKGFRYGYVEYHHRWYVDESEIRQRFNRKSRYPTGRGSSSTTDMSMDECTLGFENISAKSYRLEV